MVDANAQLHRGEVVDWSEAIKATCFVPICDSLYSIAAKSVKETVLTKFPNLDLDFVQIERVEDEVEETQTEAPQLGPKGIQASEGDGAAGAECEEEKESVEPAGEDW